MQRRWILTILLVVNIIALILLTTALIGLFENGLQSYNTLQSGIIIVFMGIINLLYVRH